MRTAVGLLICLGGLSVAWANPPSPNPGTSPAAQQSTTTSQGKPAAPAADAMATKTIRTTKPPPLTREEMNLLAAGYKLEIRGNENFFCHSEILAGTKFGQRVCQTSEQIRVNRQVSRDAMDRAAQKALQANGY